LKALKWKSDIKFKPTSVLSLGNFFVHRPHKTHAHLQKPDGSRQNQP
jgi:hypothetical protein